jgi:hypothetical protein
MDRYLAVLWVVHLGSLMAESLDKQMVALKAVKMVALMVVSMAV